MNYVENMTIITSLTNRGYAIHKTEDNKETIDKIKAELLISPKSFTILAMFSSPRFKQLIIILYI